MRDMAAELRPRSFTVAEYHQMADAGVFGPDERVELLDGLIVPLPPLGPAHWSLQAQIMYYLHDAFGNRALVVGAFSLPLGDRSEPAPDIGILAPGPYLRERRPPTPAEVFGLVEVSDSSMKRDAVIKRDIYAAFGLPDYLVVDVRANELSHFGAPAAGAYRTHRTYAGAESFSIAAFPDIRLNAAAFLSC